MALATSLQTYLAERGAPYEILEHPRTVHSSETAQASHVPGNCVAKAVVLRNRDGGCMMAVVPATHRIEMEEMRGWLGEQVELVSEDDLARLFPDCELGAIPPFGAAYGMPTVLDDALGQKPDVYFEGGDHCSLVHVSAEQFRRLMGDVRHGRFSWPN